MTRDELGALVLRAVWEREEEIANRPDPPKWKSWERRELWDDREYGPKYSPGWFGELSEANRQRTLRTLYRLSEAGLIEVVKCVNGRLERVRLIEVGREAVKEMLAGTAG